MAGPIALPLAVNLIQVLICVMKRPEIILVLIALLFGQTAYSQVTLDIALGQNRFIRDESLPVTVRVTNRSGRPIKIGNSADWLSFNLETLDGKVIAPVRDIQPGGQFQLESAESVSKAIDLSEGYELSNPGTYRLSVTAKFPEVELTVSSPPLNFDIVRGTQLWEQVCGIPDAGGATRFIRYTLLNANHLKEFRLYVRVADEDEGGVARVFPIGNGVSFNVPERIVDRSSDLHVLFQSGARTFDYLRVVPTKGIADRRSYEIRGASRPRLKLNDESAVIVVGGVLMSSTNRVSIAPAPAVATNAPVSKKP